MLRDSVLIAAAITGAQAALVIQGAMGAWYRDSSGLSSEQLAILTPALSSGPAQESVDGLLEAHGLRVVEALPLEDDCRRLVGTLYLLSPALFPLSDTQKEGLRLLAEHIRTIVIMDQHKFESRITPRPPSAASFVPGLVHELGSFIFGISANLDAFEARFAHLEELSKYGANIRRSLDRMSAFIVELREYGYPQRLSWTMLELEPLLREAIEVNLPLAARSGLDIKLHVEGKLPAISADRQGLLSAFSRMIDLVLQQEDRGSRLLLSVANDLVGNREAIAGHLDFSSVKLQNVDPARLFEPFYFRVSGLGRLTLPGARRVFESHGGTLTAGPGPDGGMRISFILPSEFRPPLPPATQL